MTRLPFLLMALAGFLGLHVAADAANRSARVSGSWNQNIWSASNSCGGAVGASVPGAADDVFICNGVTVTLDADRTVDSIRVFSGGTFNGSSHTLTIDNTVAFTLDNGGTFNPDTGTVTLNRDGNTTLVSGTAASITFNHLRIIPAMTNNRTYTLSAGSIRGITVTGDFDLSPPSASGGTVRTLTVNDGVLTNAGGGLVVGGALVLDAAGNERVTFNTGNVDMAFGRLALGGTGTGINTFTAGSATVTLNGASGPLLSRDANDIFNDGTSTVVMNSPATVDLTAGDFLRPNNSFNNLTVNMPGQTGRLGGDVDVNTNLVVGAGTLSNQGFAIDGDGTGLLQVSNGAAFDMTAASVFPTNFSAHTFQPTSTVRYLQTAARTVASHPWGHLVIAPAAGAITHAFPAGTTTVAGDLTIGDGVNAGLASAASNSATLDVEGSVGILAGATLTAHPTNSFTVHGDWTNAGTFEANGGSVTLDGTAAQAVGGTSATTFDGLVVANSAAAVTAAADFAVDRTLTLQPGSVLADGGQVITVRGDIDNAGTHSGSGRIALTGGSAPHQLSGLGTYANLELNDALGATIAVDTLVTGTLTLTAGVLTTGANVLVASADCPASVDRVGGWVAGNLRLHFPVAGPPDCTFPLGDPAGAYAPLRLDFAAVGVAGSVTASVENEDHPNTDAGVSGVDEDQSVNRYWTLKDSTLSGSFDATLNFADPADLDPGVTPASLRVWLGADCVGDDDSRTCIPWQLPAPAGAPSATQASAAGLVLDAGGEDTDLAVGESDPSKNFQREKQFIYTRELY